MSGGMDKFYTIPTSIYVAYLDENLNKLNEIYYTDDFFWLYPDKGICLSPRGDLFLLCTRMDEVEDVGAIYKIPQEAFDGIDEAHDAGFAVAVAYPNPGNSTLNIRTALQNARVEVYDVLGRLMHSQKLTENVTAIDAGDWAEGIYVWKVVSNGKEAECGKWIKE